MLEGVTAHRTADLGFARLDLDRARRTGTPEVVYAAGKTPEQTVACLEGLLDGGAGVDGSASALATRVDPPTAAAIRRAGRRRRSTSRRGARSSACPRIRWATSSCSAPGRRTAR